MTWADLLRHWAAIESDLQAAGVDVGDDVLLSQRSWRWLRTRILGCLVPGTRLSAALAKEQPR